LAAAVEGGAALFGKAAGRVYNARL
jgi:hypothetical protein